MDLTRTKNGSGFSTSKHVRVQGCPGLRLVYAGPVARLTLVGVSSLSGVTGVGRGGVTGVSGATSVILSSGR